MNNIYYAISFVFFQQSSIEKTIDNLAVKDINNGVIVCANINDKIIVGNLLWRYDMYNMQQILKYILSVFNIADIFIYYSSITYCR